MTNIEPVDMVDVAIIFQESVKHVLSNLLPESKGVVTTFIAGIILQEKPYMLVTSAGIKRAIELVFINEEYRDFIFTLHFTFFSRWGKDEDAYGRLADNIANGAGLYSVGANSNLMPNDILSGLASVTNTKALLRSNSWLVILLLLQLFVTLDIIDKRAMSLSTPLNKE